MKLRNLPFLVLTVFLINCSSKKTEDAVYNELNENKENQVSETSITSKPIGLKADLEMYDGFYSSYENTDGKISPENLPKELINYKRANITSINLEYFDKDRISNGFILTFNIDYSGYNALVVSTLDTQYNMVDYRIYPNGQGFKDYKKDTISLLTYGKNLITVELMHPNPENEPEFETDGIRKEELEISEDLKINKIR